MRGVMERTRGVVRWAAVALLAVATLEAQPTFAEVTVHDPSVVRDGGMYYVFGSHLAAAKSADLMTWTQISTSPTAGNALVPNPAVEFSEVLTWAQTNTFWAPDVIRLGDGKYYMYYCACRGDSPRSALGLAVADSIEGPYKHVAVLLRSGMSGASEDGTTYDATKHPNAVDPAVFFDQAGKLWMVYGSYSGGIFILEMDPATGRQKPGQGYGRKLMGGNHARIEGGYVLYAPETEYYYLFVSYGGLNAADGYNIRVGRSRNPDGPYVDAAGTDLATVAGAPGTFFDDASIAPHGVKLMGGYQFLHDAREPRTTSRGYLSPGHNSAYRDPDTGKYFLVFHTRFVGRGEQHEVRVHQMFLNADGWPVVAPHRYAGETIGAANAGIVAGDYKWISHGKDIAGGAKPSSLITLQADGTITGAATGTWQLAGAHFISLALSGVIYRGVVVRLWDDDNGVWVQAFTVLSGDGVAGWGSRVALVTTDAPPTIGTQPQSRSVFAGDAVTFSVAADGSPPPTFQWKKNGVEIAGATGASYSLAEVSAADAGSYTVVVTNSSGSVTSAIATLTVETVSAGGSRFLGIATRARCGTGNDVTIGGFVIDGAGPKRVLIRAVGPTLTTQGIGEAEVLADPMVTVHDARKGNEVIAANDDWGQNANAAEITAESARIGLAALAAGDTRSSALLQTLPPGVYTFVVSSKGGAPGVVLLEVYDLDVAGGGAKFMSIASRAAASTGNGVAIGGFVIGGAAPKRVLVRAVGPTLTTQGIGEAEVLADPVVTLHRSIATIAASDDWGDEVNAAAIVTTGARVGATPLAEMDVRSSAKLMTLAPGPYSFIVRGKNETSGVVLLEVYDAD
jgi:Beta-xylosidase